MYQMCKKHRYHTAHTESKGKSHANSKPIPEAIYHSWAWNELVGIFVAITTNCPNVLQTKEIMAIPVLTIATKM
jgi:hypothetical protein